MKPVSRRIGTLLLLTGLVLAGAVVAWAQTGPPPLAVLPKTNTVPITTGPATGPPAATTPATSIKDIAVEVSEAPSPANPTGRQEPGVGLEWICPTTCRIGQPVTCTIIVKSLSTNRLHNVVIHSQLPAGAQLQATEPKASMEGELLCWHLGTLEPRQEKRLDVQLIPTIKGSVACHAFVSFTGSSTARMDIREPRLVLKASALRIAVQGDPTPVTLIVSNPGNAAAEHVKVKAILTDGLEYSRGQVAEFNLENLGPGESRTVLVLCAARNVGPQHCTATATAEPQLNSTDSVAIEVVAPAVNVIVTGPSMRYLDRHAVLNFKVTNPGSATATHVTLTEQVPPGFKFVEASAGGRHDFVSHSVVWFMEDLPAGQSKEVSLDLVAINPGEYRHTATVTAARGLHSEAQLVTRVEGLSALLMELADTEDPVEVSKDTSYEIRLTNTGTKTETNLQLTCTIPDKMEFKGAKAAPGCTFKLEGRELVFSALPKLPPRADVIYRVNVRCLAPGDLRFQARVRADGLETPVLREESTRVYGDAPK